MVQLLLKTIWQFLKRSNAKLLYDRAIPLLGTYPRELKIEHPYKNVHMNVHSAIN